MRRGVVYRLCATDADPRLAAQLLSAAPFSGGSASSPEGGRSRLEGGVACPHQTSDGEGPAFARRLARRYARTFVPYEDLVQVASLALVKAVDRFEPGRGSSFEAFAVPTILGELKRYFRESTWALHVTRATQERALAVSKAT